MNYSLRIFFLSIIIGSFLVVWIPVYSKIIPTPKKPTIHLAFLKEAASGQQQVILDGKNLGPGVDIVLDGRDIAFVRDHHVIYNGKDVGIGTGVGSDIQLSNHHIVFERNDGHIIYDGKDLGNRVLSYRISGNHIGMLRVGGIGMHTRFFFSYDGKSMDPEVFSFSLYSNHLVRLVEDTQSPSLRNNNKVIFDVKEYFQASEGDPVINDHHIAYWREVAGKSHVIEDEKDLGAGDKANLSPSGILLSGNHIVFQRTLNGKKHIVYDGKDVGEGKDETISGDHLAFARTVAGERHLFYDTKNLGEIAYFGHFSILENTVAYTRVVKGRNHVILNGKDIGEGADPVLSE